MKLGSSVVGHRRRSRPAGLLAAALVAAVLLAGPLQAVAAADTPQSPSVAAGDLGATLSLSSNGSSITTCATVDEGYCLIQSGQYLESPNGQYQLVMEPSGNLELLLTSSQGADVLLWSTGTNTQSGKHACTSCAYFDMSNDGAMNVLMNSGAPDPATATTLWTPSPSTRGTPGPLLALQNDGNLVLYTDGGGGEPTWSSGTGAPTSSGDLGPTMTSTSCGTSAAGWGGCLLQPGQSLVAPARQFELLMQSDGNLVLYRRTTVKWTTGTAGNPDAYLDVQSDGNLVLYSSSHTALWSSGTAGTADPTLAMQDDGNLVLYGSNGAGGVTAAWQSGTSSIQAQSYPAVTTCDQSRSYLPAGEILAPGACLMSPDGHYELVMQTDGNLVLYFQSQSDPLWAAFPSGPPASAIGQSATLFTGEYQGELCVGAGSPAQWCNGASGPDATLVVQDDGNLVEYGQYPGGSAYALWSTSTQNLRGYRLPSGDLLQPGQYLESPNGQYQLLMSPTGTLMLAQTQSASGSTAYSCPMWTMPAVVDYGPSENLDPYPSKGAPATYSATTYDPQSLSFPYQTTNQGLNDVPADPDNPTGLVSATPTPNAYLAMQADGDLALLPPTGGSSPLWSTGTENSAGASLTLQTDGNLVVTSSSGAVAWQSGTNLFRGSALCTNDSLQEGQFLGFSSNADAYAPTLTMQSDCNLVLGVNFSGVVSGVLWQSDTGVGEAHGPTSGSTDECYVTMQDDGNFVLYQYPGGPALWSSGTSVGSSQPPTGHPYVGPFWLQLNSPYLVLERWGVGTAWKEDPTDQIPSVTTTANNSTGAIGGDIISGVQFALSNNFLSATSDVLGVLDWL